MEEVDPKSELVPIERSRSVDIGDVEHRRTEEGRGLSLFRSFADGRGGVGAHLQVGPIGAPRFESDDLLDLVEGEWQGERPTVGQCPIADELPDATADRMVALSMPADQQFCLLLVGVDRGRGSFFRRDVGGPSPFGPCAVASYDRECPAPTS